MTPRCPCCGQDVGAASPVGINAIAWLAGSDLGPRQRRIILALAERFGEWVPGVELIGRVYGSEVRGVSPDKTINEIVWRMKRVLGQRGLVIEGDRHRGRRLVWAERS